MQNENIYTVFIRTWWRANNEWPNGLEPHMGRRKVIARNVTMTEAREICKQYNDNNNPGKYSRKAEFTSNY